MLLHIRVLRGFNKYSILNTRYTFASVFCFLVEIKQFCSHQMPLTLNTPKNAFAVGARPELDSGGAGGAMGYLQRSSDPWI